MTPFFKTKSAGEKSVMRGFFTLILAALSFCVQAVDETCCHGDGPVIIVGSGMAGLAAGNAFLQSGCCAVLLEARSRIGGRTYSVGNNQYESSPFSDNQELYSYRASDDALDAYMGCDIGGHWVEGNSVDRNPIKRLIVDLGIPYRQVSEEPISGTEATRRTIRLSDENGTRWTAAEEAEAFLFFAKQCARLQALYQSRIRRGLPDISIDEGFDLISDRLTSDERKLDLFFRHWWMGLDDASFLYEDSLYAWLGEDENYDYLYDSSDPEGNGADVLVNGYGELASKLAAPLDIRLNMTVVSINQSSSGVEVTTADGTVFSGSQVIVTVPLGVLRGQSMESKHDELSIAFNPALSRERLDAIQALGFGLETHYYAMRDTTSDPSHLPYVIGYVAELPETGSFLPAWYDGVYEIDQTLKEGPSRVKAMESDIGPVNAMASGSWAREAESRSIDEVKEDVARTASYIYGGDSSIEGPFLQSMWWSDPFSQGSYSYYRVNSTRQTRDLAFNFSTEMPRMQFAGEHTCDLLYGTVVGAFVSGVRASQRVLGANQNVSWPFFDSKFSMLCDKVMDEEVAVPSMQHLKSHFQVRRSSSTLSRRSVARKLARGSGF